MPRQTTDDLALAALGLAALVATVLGTLAVITRYFFSLPISFSDELVTYIVVFSMLIAVGLGERENVHIRATVITERLGPRTQLWLSRVELVLTVIFACAMIWFGATITWQRYALHEVSPTILQFPQWVARLCVPLGFLLVAFAAVWRLRSPTAAKTEAV